MFPVTEDQPDLRIHLSNKDRMTGKEKRADKQIICLFADDLMSIVHELGLTTASTCKSHRRSIGHELWTKCMQTNSLLANAEPVNLAVC